MNIRRTVTCPHCGEYLATISEISVGSFMDVCIPETRKIAEWSNEAKVIHTSEPDVVEIICGTCGYGCKVDYRD